MGSGEKNNNCGKTKCAVIYAQGRLAHAEAVAAELCADGGPLRIILVTTEPLDTLPGWAGHCTGPDGLAELLKREGISRPELFILVVSNELRYLSVPGMTRALLVSLAARPRKRTVYLYAWSGRYRMAEAAEDVASKIAGIAARPFYLAGVRLLHLIGELIFPLVTGNPRNGEFDPAGTRRVLVISLDLIGDLVWAAPAIAALKKNMPDARVDLLVSLSNIKLGGMVEGVDNVIGYDAPWLDKLRKPKGAPRVKYSRWSGIRTRLSLLSAGYDLAVEFRGEPRDYVLMYLTGAAQRAALIGKPTGPITANDVSYLLTYLYEQPRLERNRTHVLDRHLSLVRMLGMEASARDGWLTPGEETGEKTRQLFTDCGLKPGGPIVGMQPGASRAEKCWSADGFAEVANALMKRLGARVVLFGSSGETGLGNHITNKAPGVIDLTGKTGLDEFVSSVSMCDLFISNDTSAIGISSAVKTPIVCIVAVNTQMLGPYGIPFYVLQRKPGCWDPEGEHCYCPYGYRCLQDITPSEVVAAAVKLLKPRFPKLP